MAACWHPHIVQGRVFVQVFKVCLVAWVSVLGHPCMSCTASQNPSRKLLLVLLGLEELVCIGGKTMAEITHTDCEKLVPQHIIHADL